MQPGNIARQSDEEFRRVLLTALEYRASRSREKLMRETAKIGAAKRLIDHFGSIEAVEAAGLEAQLRFLLYECEESTDTRELLGVAWVDVNAARLGLDDLLNSGIALEPVTGEVLFLRMTRQAFVS